MHLDDPNYNALIHFVSTFVVEDHAEAQAFVQEIEQGFTRRGAKILFNHWGRIDGNAELKTRQYEYCEFCRTRATASVKIEQFVLESPDQNKGLINNLTERFYNGEDSTASIGNEYNIPVRVMEKGNRNPISHEIFYYSIEHLIPKTQ